MFTIRFGNYHYVGTVVVVNLQLPMQSVPTTTTVLSSNLVHGEVHSIQHYVIKFVGDLHHVGGFPRVLRLPHQ